jgi:hypothetical protein
MEKKPYTPPTVTDHGSVVDKTKGIAGFTWEPWGHILDEDPPPPPPVIIKTS